MNNRRKEESYIRDIPLSQIDRRWSDHTGITVLKQDVYHK